MLLAFAGITGIGKSYYKNKISSELGFEKIKIITTRAPRENEVNNEDKIFVTRTELENLEKAGKIAYKFEMLGNTYAYTREDLFSNKNLVFEMHYSTIIDFKKVCPHLKTIYLLPRDINVAKEMLCQRNLDSATQKARLDEIDEHYNRIMSDKDLLNMFDYVLYNNYDVESENQVINLVKKLLKEDI